MNYLRTPIFLVLALVLVMGSFPGLAQNPGTAGEDGSAFGSEVRLAEVAPGLAIDPDEPAHTVPENQGFSSTSSSTVAAGELPPGVDEELVYAIITDPANVQALETLAEWKTQTGLRAQVFETDDIYDNYAGRDNPEDIRLFLQDLIAETPVRYLLLAGDVDTVPTRYAYCNDAYAGDGTDVPTDTYYGFLDGSWDDNADDRFGDFDNDNVVWEPDIYVGRLPDSSSGGLEDLVQNILDYEKSPPWGDWAQTALLAGAYSNFDEDSNGDNKQDGNDYRKTDEAKLCFTIEDRLLPGSLDTVRLYENEGLDPTDYDYDRGLTKANISSSLGYGQSVVNLAGHGSDTGIYRTVWTSDSDADSLCDPGSEQTQPVFLDTSVSPSNGEKRPLVYIDACNSGAYDKSYDSLAEHVVNDFGIGAVAASRVSWYSVGWDPGTDGGSSNQGHSYRFWEQFFDGNWGPGEALYESKADYVDDAGVIDIYDMKNLLNYNLIGDPQLPVWTASPDNLTVDHPQNISSNEEKLVFEVVDRLGGPVEGARITIINNELYLTALTDVDGKREFEFTEEIDSNIQLTVTVHNFLPYEAGIVAVHPPVLEDLSFSAVQAYRGKDTVSIFVNGSDDKYDEDELDCQLEYRAPTGDWTTLGPASFDNGGSLWTLSFSPDTDFGLGSYDFRARLVDLDEAASDWQEFTGAVEVLNNLPAALDIRLSFATVNRTQSVVIQADGGDTEDAEDQLFYQIQYRSPIGAWNLLGSGNYVGGSWEFQFDTEKSMDIGFYDFRVKFTDTDAGGSDWFEQTDILEVLNISPEAVIDDISPDKLDQGEEVSFSGGGSDPDGSVTAYSWRSERDGFLGGQQFFDLSTLSNGTHLIYLKVMDSDGSWSEEVSSTVTVNGIPRAVIESLSLEVLLEGETVEFWGNGSDDGNISLYRWHSNQDGILYQGPLSSFNSSTLKLGEHFIKLQVRDSDGSWSEEVNTTVLVHEAPVADIISIAPNPALNTQKLFFEGEGTDDGSIQILMWRIVDSEDQEVMSGSEPPEQLDAGSYIVYFKVQDNHGVWSLEVNHTLLVHRKPMAFITRVNPSTAIEGEQVRFEGGGNDDGQLLRYSWRTEEGETLYNGSESSFTHNGFLTGNHSIYFMVMDDYGIWSNEVSVTVVAHHRPIAEVEEVIPKVVLRGGAINFSASAIDDGTIAQYAWSSDIDGEFYNGSEASCICILPSQGDHIITLRVKDENEAWSEGVTTTVKVHRRPVATISSISPNPAQLGEIIRFSGAGSDDGSIARYAWRSDIDGEFYNSSHPTTEETQLSPGIHNISFTVQDDRGVWSSWVQTTITVEDEPVDEGSDELILFQEVGPLPVFAYLGLLAVLLLLGLVFARRGGKDEGSSGFSPSSEPDKAPASGSSAPPPPAPSMGASGKAGPEILEVRAVPPPPPPPAAPRAPSNAPTSSFSPASPPPAPFTSHKTSPGAPTPGPPGQPKSEAGLANWNCPICGKQVSGKFVFCVHCGTHRR